MAYSKSLKYYFLVGAIVFMAAGLALHFVLKQEPLDAEEYLVTVEGRLSDAINKVQREVVHVIEHIEKNQQIDFTSFNANTTYPYYIYKDGRLVYWSDYRYVPEYRFLKGDYRYKFIRTIRKDFLSRRWSIAATDYEIFAIIPLYTNYKVDNNYLKSGYNRALFSDQQLSLHQLSDKAGREVCLGADDQCYFKVKFEQDYVQNRRALNLTIASLISLSLILMVIWVYSHARQLRAKSIETGFLFLLAVFMAMRWLMLWLNFPQRLINSELFDSRYFASSSINPSLGDLFLNLVLSLILVAFIFNNYTKLRLTGYLLNLKKVKRGLVSIVLAGLLPFLLHIEFLLFQTIYHNSQLTFDINQTIHFDGSRTLAYLCIIILSAAIFLGHHIFYKLLKKLNPTIGKFAMYYLAGLLVFGLINYLIDQRFVEVLIVSLVYVSVLVATSLPRHLYHVRYNTFLYFFSIIITVAVVGALAIFRFENERDFERKNKFVNQFLIENDNLAEFLLSEVNQKIKDDVFIQSRLSSPFLNKEVIKSKIRQVYLSNYFDKYEVKIYLYNSSGQPLDKQASGPGPGAIEKFNVENYATNYEGIYFINKLGGEVTKRYLDFIEVKRRGARVGYIILDLNLKRIIPENVYPELLVDNAFLFPYQDANYSYAVFEGEDIAYNSGSFNYNTDFDVSLLSSSKIFRSGLKYNGFSHLAMKDPAGRVVVISSDLHPFSDIISNFSFLFLIHVFTLLALTAFYALYFSLQKAGLNYSARIQLYLNVAFFLPLFAVSVTTLSLINSSFKKEVNEDYHRKARSISSNISEDLDEYVNEENRDSDVLPNKLTQVAKFSGVDVNLFNINGRLISSSQPLIYENNLISRFINPEAYAKIREQNENVFIARESVGSLDFNTTYYAVKSYETGSLIGILSIPFFQSEYALEQNQIEVLTNVINIFTIIFIVFLLISYLAAKWLTFPLAFITQKLKKTTLTGFNEPLAWKSDDEIGLMVGEYNRMLINLEDSKKALARSEKESAWREIAQQVAHEIKNPLTPMKLTLQHLRRKLIGRPDEKELERPITTLLHEIETLNDIATSFSSFAKLPIPENERYELTQLIRKAVNLHRSTEGVSIDLQLPDREVYTVGDEQLMSRIISNIILNAIQANEDKCRIEVSLKVADNQRLLLEIKDNGPGIAEEIHSKIFVPNFSTKETGSGIGLAIAKHGVEHAGGKIWFETEMGQGTSFYIELPMVVS